MSAQPHRHGLAPRSGEPAPFITRRIACRPAFAGLFDKSPTFWPGTIGLRGPHHHITPARAPVARRFGPVSGACRPRADSLWPVPLPRPSPPRPGSGEPGQADRRPLCSRASTVLRDRPTSHVRASSACVLGLPDPVVRLLTRRLSDHSVCSVSCIFFQMRTS